MSRGPTDLQTAQVETAWGRITLEATEKGIRRCCLPEAPTAPVPFRVLRTRISLKASRQLQRGVDYICAVLAGRDPGPCPPLDPAVKQSATPFRRAVWRVIRCIPRGRTLTYSELSRRAGFPFAARATGGACGVNPLPLFVPCHRVTGASGRLGGFSAGVVWKRLLLDMEKERK